MTPQPTKLLLVYNANGGILNMLMDGMWKIFSPSTYPCSLCAITYGAVSMHNDWKRFLKSLPLEIVFHHKDDFAKAYPGHDFALPTILIKEEDAPPRVLVSNTELDAIEDTVELMERVEKGLIDEHLRSPRLKIVA